MHCSEIGLSPCRSADGETSFHRAAWAVGATGAVTANSKNTRGFTLTRSSAGIYTVVLPVSFVGLPPIVIPVTDTAVSNKVTAFDATAGTATIEFMDAAGAAVELTSGDAIHLLCYCSATIR